MMRLNILTKKELQKRIERAKEASQNYTVVRQGNGTYLVRNGEGSEYTVTFARDAETLPTCTCPDYKKNGLACKHVAIVLLARKPEALERWQARVEEEIERLRKERTELIWGPADPDPFGTGSKAREEKQPEPSRAVQEPEAREETKAAEVVVHWGKHQGRTLGELATEAPGFIAWLAFKSQPRTEEDRRLQQAARKVYDTLIKKNGKKASGKSKSGAELEALAQEVVRLLLEAFQKAMNSANGGEPC